MSEGAKALEFGAALLERRGAVGRAVGLLVDLTLVLIVGILIAKLFWAILAPSALVSVANTRTIDRAPQASNVSMLADPRVLQEFNPFDRNLVEVVAVETEDAPETSLNLEIAGLWAANDPESSFVRIRTPDDQVRRFRPGDTVVPGVVIDRIANDRVILVRNGQREALLQREVRFLGTVEPDRPVTSVPQPAAPVPETPVVERSNAAPSDGGSDFIQSKTISLSSVDEFNSKLDMVRQADETGAVRMTITGNSDRDLLEALSVNAGDAVLSVNGNAFELENLQQLYESMRTQRVLTFVLSRDGQTFTRIVNIENGVRD